ncbi:9674_t:CDS:2 [Paraglomus occultum]|uniref:9674_t:CDS:1 n=1 Tax=Paraglomus occultum TaxID=144539 RepID=A0A9N8ZBQ9_9GLOM|nr:9674_t:CDS:2 [Paraglomus occultum]
MSHHYAQSVRTSLIWSYSKETDITRLIDVIQEFGVPSYKYRVLLDELFESGVTDDNIMDNYITDDIHEYLTTPTISDNAANSVTETEGENSDTSADANLISDTETNDATEMEGN